MYLPLAQAVPEATPVAHQLPAEHAAHVSIEDAPVAAEYLPCAHCVHDASPTETYLEVTEYVPAAQLLQFA